jgi:hypothetical protein
MAKVSIANGLQMLVEGLGALRTATPVTASEYPKIVKRYTEASDRLEQANKVAIDAADSDYVEFAAEMKKAIAALDEAKAQMAKISKAIEIAGKVVDIAGKIVTKLAG